MLGLESKGKAFKSVLSNVIMFFWNILLVVQSVLSRLASLAQIGELARRLSNQNSRFIKWSESNMIRVCSGTFRVLTDESGYIDRYHLTPVNNVVTLPRFWVI